MSEQENFLAELDRFAEKWGESAACEIMSALIDQRLASEDFPEDSPILEEKEV